MGVDANLNGTIGFGQGGLVYDPQRNVIHFVGADGTVSDYSLASQSFIGNYSVGGTPDSVDITPDGAYLLIGNSAVAITSAPGAATTAATAEVTRVNLTTHAIDHIDFSISYDALERGVAHIGVAADGTAVVSTNFEGSGGTPLREFNAEAAAPVVTRLAGATEGQADFILPSDNRQHLLIEDTNDSGGGEHIFSSGSDSITANYELVALGGPLASGFNAGQGGYNEAKGWLVDFTASSFSVRSGPNLPALVNLNPLLFTAQGGNHVVGADLYPDGNHLFVWEAIKQDILVIDTTTWQQVGAMSVKSIEPFPTNDDPAGQMQVIDGGHTLMLTTGGGAELIDLTLHMHANATGGDGNDVLNGTVGSDILTGGAGADTLSGGEGDDALNSGAGADSVTAGAGNDTVTDTGGSNYLRGDDGDDSIQGGSDFDDINGNKGADTIDGGTGGHDWLVGGQGDDLITGQGADILWGNLGNDTLHGGTTDAQLRGGQGDDSIAGGSGNEFISGDRGNDTESGGAGADIFHGSQDAGIDRVLDFHVSEGDRVQLDPGTTYTVSQVGGDTVIDMGAGVGGAANQMILVGVQMSTLHADSIFLG